MSNAPFLVVGLLGLRRLAGRSGARGFGDPRERRAYLVFFLGVALTGVGSAYYHLAPDNARLVWDRLPITVAFMALAAAVLTERIDVDRGARLLVPAVALGIASAVYWHVTESAGRGDLRPYAAVQFGPMLLLPLAFALYAPRYTRGKDFMVALAIYAGAKVFEALDGPIFRLGGVVGGHALKHLVAALACYRLLRMLDGRGPISMTPPRSGSSAGCHDAPR